MTDTQRIAKVCFEQHLMFSICPDHLRFSVHAELHANDIFLSDTEVDALISERLGFPIQDVIDAQNNVSECVDGEEYVH
jgi:hypothetical protein